MKSIVKPIESIMLINPETREVVWNNRPSVVTWTNFIAQNVGAGVLSVLATDLPEEADDEAFEAYFKEAPEMAVDSYVSSFAPAPEEKKKPK